MSIPRKKGNAELMNKQGYSLGKQLSGFFAKPLVELCQAAEKAGRSVWFLGRDCDVFYEALRYKFPNIRYIAGLNRENARKLQHRGNLSRWLKSFGVCPGDVLIDSGFRGSIFERIRKDNGSFFRSIIFVLLSADPEHVGYALMPMSIGDDSPLRHAVLALEHSPKRHVCSWDDVRRVPKVRRADEHEYQKAEEFFRGCVRAIREAIM